MTVFKPTGQRENQLLCTCGNMRSSMKTLLEIKGKETILLVDRASHWFQNGRRHLCST